LFIAGSPSLHIKWWGWSKSCLDRNGISRNGLS